MSEPKLISPLLDGFAMGEPMSSHDGVECCPAIRENSDRKYIVKVISIPATQTQMDAMLLAGAYRDPADAMDYFRQVGEDVIKEAELLTNLSKLEGFLPYEAWQMEPITSKRLGYQVYLVGSYKRSLEKYVRRNPVTHLEAVNLGLDMCAALMVCRQAGALYVDLKPTNIFISDKKEYRIGDLGFIRLDALKYTELPNKYRSVYTPPELHDSFATLNLTLDTYAVGMILYQLYNEGQLPFKEKAPSEPLPSPANADYELAEIIMKAIHPDPAQRWEDPKAMGQALVGYMQRNTVNDTPITPYKALELDTTGITPVAPAVEEAPASPEPAQPSGLPAEQETLIPEAVPAEAAAAPQMADETLPEEADGDSLLPHEMTDELSRMIAKAEDLISHEAPEQVVVPEPKQEDPFDFVAKNFDEIDDSDVPFDPIMEEEDRHRKPAGSKTFAVTKDYSKVKKAFSLILTLAILGALAFGGIWFYQNYYLQTVDSIAVSGDRNEITVEVKTGIDNSLLTVICSDNYGNVMRQGLVNGQASFTDLRPDTMYRIELEISGFHSLVGQTSDIFSTDASTSIVNFTAVTGPEDGSVILNFTADGAEPDKWVLLYSTEGENERKQTFEGHTLTVTGLTVGKVYTFTLTTSDNQALTGKYTLDFMASRLILAENLTITSTGNNDMTVHWDAPGDIIVDSWNVRCYNAAGYEEQITVTETEVSFTDVDPTYSYTVEVTAAGMTQPARTGITENPINISAFAMDESDANQLIVNWTHNSAAPQGGWLIMYSVDGSSIPNVIKSDSASAVISPRIPGAVYQITVQAADATSIFGNVFNYNCPEAPAYDGNGLTAKDISMHLVKRPENKDWTYESIGAGSFQTQFASGEKISIVLHGGINFYLNSNDIKILYVIEDAHGNSLPRLAVLRDGDWKDIWLAGDYHYGELDLPNAPTAAGNYKVRIYFDGAFVAETDFSVS